MGPDGAAKPGPAKPAPAAPRVNIDDELHGYYLEDLELGMTAVYAKTITDADIVLFAGISGDTNPLHLNSEFADGTRFEGRVAHGMLTASFISAVIGTKLPGPGCIYMSQTIRWSAPVRAGDTVVARVTITDINREKERVLMDTTCSVGEEVVLEGECLAKVPARADRTQ
jgi:3-hydroxybutyryl-CoA dehydratase